MAEFLTVKGTHGEIESFSISDINYFGVYMPARILMINDVNIKIPDNIDPKCAELIHYKIYNIIERGTNFIIDDKFWSPYEI
jgi:hypothetical protein